MKMTNDAVYNLFMALTRLLDVTGYDVSYAVAKNIKNLETEVGFFENQRKKLLEKYGEKVGDEFQIKNTDEKFPEFAEEYQKLLTLEVDIGLYKLPSSTTLEAFRCNTAKASDILLAMEYLVEKESDKKDESGTD